MTDNVEKFIEALAQSLKEDTFVKLSLGNYKGTDPHLQKLLVRLVGTKKGRRLYILFRSEKRDTAKNFDVDTGVAMIAEALETGFLSAHLFTTERDIQLAIGKKKKARFSVGKPTFATQPSLDHDREKTALVDPNSFYLKALGITDDNGRVHDKQQDKWRQINKFVEILASLVDKSELKDQQNLNIVDMGSGKGYLTFAAYDYFANVRKVRVTMTGVDAKTELVELCSGIASASQFEGLSFAVGSIGHFDVGNIDILIALHACNTATDDALYQGIMANADLMIAAPCCHQEIRPQITPPAMLRDILKHGIMLERTAETITDGLRSLLLERSGYATKLFEFVAAEHTPKNNMLVGTRRHDRFDPQPFATQIRDIKAEFGIRHQHLEQLIEAGPERTPARHAAK